MWLNCVENPPPYGEVVIIRSARVSRPANSAIWKYVRRRWKTVNGFEDFWAEAHELEYDVELKAQDMESYEWEASDDRGYEEYEDDY